MDELIPKPRDCPALDYGTTAFVEELHLRNFTLRTDISRVFIQKFAKIRKIMVTHDC